MSEPMAVIDPDGVIVDADSFIDSFRALIARPAEDVVDGHPWNVYLEWFAIPLRVAEAVQSDAQIAMAHWLVAGYEHRQAWGMQEASVVEFCKAVNSGLMEMGLEHPPSSETLRDWYYTIRRSVLQAVWEEHGFGAAAAANMSGPDARIEELVAAGLQEAAETGKGLVSCIQQIKRANAGHNEEKYDLGLPRFEWDTVTGFLYAAFRDGISVLVFPRKTDVENDRYSLVAWQHMANLLRLRQADK